MRPELAFEGATNGLPTAEEKDIAGRIGLPSPSAWLLAYGDDVRRPGAVALSGEAIVEAGGYARPSAVPARELAAVASVETVFDRLKLVGVASSLDARGLGAGKAAAIVASALGVLRDPRHFVVCATDGHGVDPAAFLHVRRSVSVEAFEEDGPPDVDYELQVISVGAAGKRSGIADAACHAALGRQFDRDMLALGRCLQLAGYDREVLCNVFCHSDAMREPSSRIADLLRYRQDVFRDYADFDLGGFPDFRDPSVLDF